MSLSRVIPSLLMKHMLRYDHDKKKKSFVYNSLLESFISPSNLY
jgi:hypothetical protein